MFLVCKHANPHIKDGGRIINTASTTGIYSFYQDSMDYDASKAGVIAMTRSLAKEMAPKGVLVNTIAPGWVDTDMNKDLPAEAVKHEVSKIWLKRMGKPEEIANLALFLASDDSSFITGSTIVIDGGVDRGN